MTYYKTDKKGNIPIIRIHDNGYKEEKGYIDGTFGDEPWKENNWFVPKEYPEYYEIPEEDVVLEML